MLIAQISDFHVTAPGVLAYGHVDTNGALANAVITINALRPQPDLVIGTGDLTQTGSDDEYAALTSILAHLHAPFAPAIGNHDRRAGFRRGFAAFGAPFEPAQFIQYTLGLGELRLVVLDTVREGSDDPEFCEARASWLMTTLDGDLPTIIVMHHPPFASGTDWLDPANPNWSDPIGRALEGRPNVIRILCGHVHRGIHRTWRGVPASTAPSTAHQVVLDLTPGAEPRFSFEAPGFQLHSWDGQDFVTYAASIEGFSEQFPPTTAGYAS